MDAWLKEESPKILGEPSQATNTWSLVQAPLVWMERFLEIETLEVEMHPFNEILQSNVKVDAERALIQAVIWLSVSPGFTGMTKEEIYDHLVATYRAEFEAPRMAAGDM